ncbi:MAG: hypothetical protein J4F36_11280 [Nitrosopumilaceae archaeon]|nr:hypothetical protein [Nitrosopumilaceae archaeon]
MKILVIVLFSLFTLFSLNFVFADEENIFIIDGFSIIVSEKIVSDIILNWDSPHLSEGSVTLSEQYNGTIQIKIPKSMPRMVNVDFGSTLNAIQTNGEWKIIKETESNCFYYLDIQIVNSDYVEIASTSVATGNWEILTENNPECTMQTQILETKELSPLKHQLEFDWHDITCPNPDHILSIRSNDKLACVYFETAKHLKWKIIPGPETGFTPTEIPDREYQDAQERTDYAEALAKGTIDSTISSPKLSDKELDAMMNKLIYSELDRSILPIASIAIDYEAGRLVLFTPDLTIGDKIESVIGDTPFVLLWEQAPPRWEHGDPKP